MRSDIGKMTLEEVFNYIQRQNKQFDANVAAAQSSAPNEVNEFLFDDPTGTGRTRINALEITQPFTTVLFEAIGTEDLVEDFHISLLLNSKDGSVKPINLFPGDSYILEKACYRAYLYWLNPATQTFNPLSLKLFVSSKVVPGQVSIKYPVAVKNQTDTIGTNIPLEVINPTGTPIDVSISSGSIQTSAMNEGGRGSVPIDSSLTSMVVTALLNGTNANGVGALFAAFRGLSSTSTMNYTADSQPCLQIPNGYNARLVGISGSIYTTFASAISFDVAHTPANSYASAAAMNSASTIPHTIILPFLTAGLVAPMPYIQNTASPAIYPQNTYLSIWSSALATFTGEARVILSFLLEPV